MGNTFELFTLDLLFLFDRWNNTGVTNEELKEKAEKFFKDHSSIHCPAFPHDKVYLNSKGLNHLFYKGGNRARTHKEVSVRVELLDRALKLLKLMPLAQEEDFIYNHLAENPWLLASGLKAKDYKLLLAKY